MGRARGTWGSTSPGPNSGVRARSFVSKYDRLAESILGIPDHGVRIAVMARLALPPLV